MNSVEESALLGEVVNIDSERGCRYKSTYSYSGELSRYFKRQKGKSLWSIAVVWCIA